MAVVELSKPCLLLTSVTISLNYTLLFTQPPFTSGNRQKIQQKIIKDKVKLPAFLSSEAHSLLKRVKFLDLHHTLVCNFVLPAQKHSISLNRTID